MKTNLLAVWLAQNLAKQHALAPDQWPPPESLEVARIEFLHEGQLLIVLPPPQDQALAEVVASYRTPPPAPTAENAAASPAPEAQPVTG